MNKVILLPAGIVTGVLFFLFAGVVCISPELAVAQTAEKEPPPPPEKIKTPREKENRWIIVPARTVEGKSSAKFVMYNHQTGESYATNTANTTWERMTFKTDPSRSRLVRLFPSAPKK